MNNKEAVRVRIEDIPSEGKSLNFELACEPLNARIALDRARPEESSVPPPDYVFSSPPEVELSLSLEGSTVVVAGQVSGSFVSPCVRCTEEAKTELDLALDLILKPASNRKIPGADEEDLHFGIYDGEEVNCTEIAEEFLVLSLPFVVVCSENCKGLCPHCGKNLNLGLCGCKPEETGDPRLSVLRALKITQ